MGVWYQNIYPQIIHTIPPFAGLEEAQAGIKIAGRNINKLRYSNHMTLMTKNKEELKSLLMKVKVKEESEKVGLKQHSGN